ncbi:MAG: four helix bundle protein [Chloroflexota bacterium]
MNEKEFKDKTKRVALGVIRLVEDLPNTKVADVLGRQVLRSATSIGANYRAACRAKSTADMINKLKIVEEESDETLYWFELLTESGIISPAKTPGLYKETDEILSMTVASIKTLRSRKS